MTKCPKISHSIKNISQKISRLSWDNISYLAKTTKNCDNTSYPSFLGENFRISWSKTKQNWFSIHKLGYPHVWDTHFLYKDNAIQQEKSLKSKFFNWCQDSNGESWHYGQVPWKNSLFRDFPCCTALSLYKKWTSESSRYPNLCPKMKFVLDNLKWKSMNILKNIDSIQGKPGTTKICLVQHRIC